MGDPYCIASTPVTFDQYDLFCVATGYEKPITEFGRGQLPVINVNVSDALAYCKWLSKKMKKAIRLPEEKEWVYAAKGGSKSKGCDYSGSRSLDDVGWYDNNSGKKPHTVAQKKPNELGIYDMSGNVWELCGTSGAVRGGSWCSFKNLCHVSSRYDFDPIDRYNILGFRVLQKR